MSDIRERLLAGETVDVVAPHSGRKFGLRIHTASLGVRFVTAINEKGKRIRNANLMWNTFEANDWLDHLQAI